MGGRGRDLRRIEGSKRFNLKFLRRCIDLGVVLFLIKAEQESGGETHMSLVDDVCKLNRVSKACSLVRLILGNFLGTDVIVHDADDSQGGREDILILYIGQEMQRKEGDE